jgi:threonine/homoserine/homoserine lactone efflux protein
MAYVIALLVIVAANFVAVRFGSLRTKRTTLVVSAGLPVILGVIANLWFAYRNGFSTTLHDPHFAVFWMMVGGATLATTATALLGRGLAPRKEKRETP